MMDPIDITQKILRFLFYLFVAATLVGFSAEKWFDYPNTYWVWCGMGAIGTSLIRFFLRFV